MVRALLTLVVLAVLLVAADGAVKLVAQERAGEQVGDVLGAPARVTLGGWPVSWHLLQGSVPRAEIVAHDVPLTGGARADRLEVTLDEVRVRWRDLSGPAERLPPAVSGRFTVHLGEAAVQQLLGVPEQVVGVELAQGHVVIVLADLVELEADVEVRDGQLAVVPTGDVAALLGAAAIPVDLSEQPGRPAVDGVEVTPGLLVVHGMLREVNG